MTNIYVARPPAPQPPITPPQSYSISPEARADMLKGDNIVEPLKYPTKQKGPYLMTGGSSFDFELNVLDTASKRPIRGVEIEAGLKKGFTDRLGRLVMHLPRGHNKVVIAGHGFIEAGDFTPQSVQFEPMVLEVDLDSNSVFTVYSTGEIIPGERKVLDNPGHASGDLGAFLNKYWWAIGLVGATGLTFYYLGKSRTQSDNYRKLP